MRANLPPADVWNAIATIMLVIIGVVGIFATNRSLELSERGWVNVGGVGLARPLVAGDALHYAVVVNNTGKEPALDVTFLQDTNQILPPANYDFNNAQVPENTTCDGSKVVVGAGVVTPNGGVQHTTDSGRGNHPVSVDDRFLSGQAGIVTQGCVAYKTFNRIHHTRYCAVFMMVPITRGASASPPTQAAAVTQPAPSAAAGPSQAAATSSSAPGLALQVSMCPNGNSAD